MATCELTDPRAHVRITGQLRQQISTGKLHPGQPTPSITELAAASGYARGTCAKALRTLEAEGLIVRIPGLGYHVR